jgi:hypothetical protein
LIIYHSASLQATVRTGLYCADEINMRYLVMIVLVVAGVIFLRQQTSQNPAPKNAAEATVQPAQPTLTPRPASEHDWAKSAIDRTNEVRQQVKRERASNEVP